ncbi:MAG: hypothetical protein FD180_5203 [Planctomycetota bacterium]|nr:MAG: hypothetical protein FD180_5203 [Planctomycetota bacterium]
MKSYTLLNGLKLDLRDLSRKDHSFLRDLRRMVERDIDYFEIVRMAVGHGSPALRGRQTIDPRTAAQPIYLVAEDIADRAGMAQGLVLAPEFEHLASQFPADCSNISALQAADLIGISRAAVHKAVHAGKIQALRIGNVTVINRKSADKYRRNREAVAKARVSSGKARTAQG